MKTVSTLLITIFLLCSCSNDQNIPARAIISGTNIVCNNGVFVLFVTKRDGNSIEGVKININKPDATVTTLTADKGTVSKSQKPNCFKIQLLNGDTQKGTAHTTWQLSEFDLQPMNIVPQ